MILKNKRILDIIKKEKSNREVTMAYIIIAGAGHGGLVAGAILAQHGYDVTVYEKKQKNELGYDWHDRFDFSLLTGFLGISTDELNKEIWEYRGDCAFVSPSKNKKIIINYDEDNRQKIMWRKHLIQMLVSHAEQCGVKFVFGAEISSPVITGARVCGFKTSDGKVITADLTIDAAGINSPLRTGLPKYFNIENAPKNGEVFYAYRAYFDKKDDISPDAPFEIYLRHEGDKGLSWCYTAENYVDILIGRTTPLTDDKVSELLDGFRSDHPWIGNRILHGGCYGIIPVRRPLTLMVADGYAAVGDSAFMTTPMNGMGIDLSIEAGKLLAETVVNSVSDHYSASVLWDYNMMFHVLFGGETAKNEGLKNSLLKLPKEGVDFLFENEVIQSSDLAGAGRTTDVSALLGKFRRGMKKPPYFLAIINGLLKGSKTASLYKDPPVCYDIDEILKWMKKIEKNDIK